MSGAAETATFPPPGSDLPLKTPGAAAEEDLVATTPGKRQPRGAQHVGQGGGAPTPPEADGACLPGAGAHSSAHTISSGGGWCGSSAGGGELFRLWVAVQGVGCLGVLDTGSSVTLVRPDVLPIGLPLERTEVQLRTVTGELSPMLGVGVMQIQVAGLQIAHKVWVADIGDPCILGVDFLEATGGILDMGGGTLSFPSGLVAYRERRDISCVPRARGSLNTGVWAPQADRPKSPAMISQTFNNNDIAGLSPFAPPFTPGATPTRVGQSGKGDNANEGMDMHASSTPTVHALTPTRDLAAPVLGCDSGGITGAGHVERDGGALDERQQKQLSKLLGEYEDCFARDEGEVGMTHLATHGINTGDAAPIKCRPRHLPLVRQEACDKAVEEMLAAGTIEPSDSPWASGVVMVPKKNGGWRLCADYRPLNKVTIKDSYPIPRIDEALDMVSGSKWFSSLDLRSGYYQVPLDPESRQKTAFCTGRGLWQFKVMSFGLCNAPATFARLMDKVLAGVPREQCLVYLDDILAHGKSFDSALGALRQVLERIRAAGLKLHPDKCRFMQREVTFLGHKVNGEGVGTMRDKVEAVRNWPVPANKRQLKSFIGLASYYRRFVKDFATIAAPLHRQLEKNRPFLWTQECQQAFQRLQEALCGSTVLAPPDPSLPFILDTDASNEGVGGVLSQIGPEGEKVVAYFSRSFGKAERNYCVTRRELLAVMLAVRHFKYYLCGLPFVVRTDHAALQWLMSFREPEGQIARWLEELQAYDFTIEHRAGQRHGNADALSRRPCAASACHYCERVESREKVLLEDQEEGAPVVSQREEKFCGLVQSVGADEWRREQEQDADLQPVLERVEAHERPSWEEVGPLSRQTKGLWSKFDELRVHQGVLQRAWVSPEGGETWQVVVPRSMQQVVLEAMHGTPGSGHFGATKTLRRLRQGYYWGNYQRDVTDFCRRCDPCTARKGPTGRSQAPLQQCPAGAPLERVAVDIVGPLPVTERGNKYILTAMDYFTKWPEAYAIADMEAETVADALVEGMFCRFGVPETLHSDQGRNFESKVFAAMCERLGIHKTRTTPLHPQSDGLVERFNRTLGEQLALHVGEDQRDWDKQLPVVLLACRSAVQESTGCSPALLMLGNELRTPAVMAFGQPPDAPEVPPGPEYARRLQDRLEAAHKFARAQVQGAQVRQKRNYDIRSRGRDFEAGELVWVYEPKRKRGRIPKLDSHWTGPCRVIARVGEVVYRVQLPFPRRRKVVLHRDRLAPYRGAAVPQGESPARRPEEEAALGEGPVGSPQGVAQDLAAVGDSSPLPGPSAPKRKRRAPRYLDDYDRS